MLVFAHRGYSGKYPENTMTAFKKAHEANADGIELDVQFTKDKQLVIIHDEKIDRTTNGTGYVKDYTLEELKQFNAAKVHNETCKEETIPSLDEYLNWVKDTNLITNIELKTGVYYYSGIEEATLNLVKKYNLEDKVIFSSFNPLSVVKIKELAPDIKVGLLTESGGIQNAGQLCKDFHFDYYHPDKKDLTQETIDGCKECGIGLNVWTVNDLEFIHKLYEANANAIITNYPDIPKIYLNNLQK